MRDDPNCAQPVVTLGPIFLALPIPDARRCVVTHDAMLLKSSGSEFPLRFLFPQAFGTGIPLCCIKTKAGKFCSKNIELSRAKRMVAL